MRRLIFEEILIEEGTEDRNLRGELWHSLNDSGVVVDEARAKEEARRTRKQMPELLMRQALNRAMDPLLGRL